MKTSHLILKPISRGFTLIELIIVISIVSILATVLLTRLLDYQEQAEKVAMEQTAGIIRSALQLQVAALIASDHVGDIPKLVDENPMTWLAEKPHNYQGEYFDPVSGQIPPGSWYYDLKQKQLVYLVDRGRHFLADSGGRKAITYKVALAYNTERQPNQDSLGRRSVGGVVLQLARPYQWNKS